MPVMKRTFLLILAMCLIAPSVSAQITGTGTFTNPYRGINAGDFTISGTKYFDSNLGVSAGTLRLMPGTTLICKSRYACIMISGTGRLVAQGSSSMPVLITADTDGDHIAGESTDSWGNIYHTSSGTSSLQSCTVENGQRTRSRYFGGALHVVSGKVNVLNCTIRNCTAQKGGAVYVENGAELTIANSVLYGNTATDQGGAVYVAAGTAPLIASSIIYNNNSLSTLNGGGAIAAISSSPVIVNTSFASNTSMAADGNTIYLENSPGAIILNTVIWGGSSHIGLSGTSSSVFEFCAIEGETLPGCITLGSSNTAPDGPNFINPAAGDLSIAFMSPLRDAGTGSHPSVQVPPIDFIGAERIGPPDIGAIEVTYSRWQGGNSSWGDPVNWEKGLVPAGTNIVIPAGTSTYPTAAPGPSFTLNTGLNMIIEPGAKATFNSITNSGTIYLRSDATGYASMLTNSFSGAAGNVNVEHFLTSGPTGDWWHYIAPPATVSKTVFTDIEPEMLVRYDESKVVSDVSDGWQWHDGYDGTTPFSQLTAKEGYDVSVVSDVTMTYRNLKSLTTSMGRIDLPFSGSGGDTTIYGYSLIGNSLTCGINWDLVSYSHDHEMVRHAYYVRTAAGEEASYVDGVGTNGATAHIAPLQGFFVRTRATGTFINIANSAREHGEAPRFKSSEQIPLLRLALSSDKTSDEMIIRFRPEATFAFDGLYDAGKPFSHLKEQLKIYSVMGPEEYSINSIPMPSQKVIIPLTLEIPDAGTFKLTRSQLQYTGNTRFVLTDNLTGRKIDLNVTPEYSFPATPGTITGRFALTVIPEKKSVAAAPSEMPETDAESLLKIYAAQGRVCILPQGNDWDGVRGKVRIFDITGRIILVSEYERFNSGELKEFYPGDVGNLLIVEVTAGDKRYLEKVVLSR